MDTKTVTMGLVIRATKTKNADRALMILTPNGIINAMAKGALNLKSNLFNATNLFCYSEFTLYEGKNMDTVDEALVHEVFWELRNSLENFSLATYFAELCATFSPSGQDADAQLRLLLNSLHFLCKEKRPPLLIKAVYEMRALTLAGFMPNLVACAGCMKYDGGPFCFDVAGGQILCADCAAKRDLACNLDEGALSALRHIVLCEDGKLFAFTLGEQSTRNLEAVTDAYALYRVGRSLRSREYLKTVLPEMAGARENEGG